MHLNATSSLNTFFFSPSCFPQNKTEKKILKIDLIMVCGTLYLNLNSIKREYRQSVSQSVDKSFFVCMNPVPYLIKTEMEFIVFICCKTSQSVA